ncbi:3651_t:CDS:1, partial [Cetraspora pellucida]
IKRLLKKNIPIFQLCLWFTGITSYTAGLEHHFISVEISWPHVLA